MQSNRIDSHGTFTATGTSAVAVCGEQSFFGVSISGTFVGTIALQYSFDNSTWFTDTAGPYTAAANFIVDCPSGSLFWRLNCTAYTSGTVTYRLFQ